MHLAVVSNVSECDTPFMKNLLWPWSQMGETHNARACTTLHENVVLAHMHTKLSFD